MQHLAGADDQGAFEKVLQLADVAGPVVRLQHLDGARVEPSAGAIHLAAELGDVHEQQVWRFLRSQKIDLSGQILVREQ